MTKTKEKKERRRTEAAAVEEMTILATIRAMRSPVNSRPVAQGPIAIDPSLQ